MKNGKTDDSLRPNRRVRSNKARRRRRRSARDVARMRHEIDAGKSPRVRLSTLSLARPLCIKRARLATPTHVAGRPAGLAGRAGSPLPPSVRPSSTRRTFKPVQVATRRPCSRVSGDAMRAPYAAAGNEVSRPRRRRRRRRCGGDEQRRRRPGRYQ